MKEKDKCNLLRDGKITLKEKSIIRMIELNDITYISCQGYLSEVYTRNNSKITVSKLLKHFETELSNSGFIRINHNTIINSKYLETIERGGKRKIILVGNIELYISRRKMYLVRELLK